jgi:hypothetical protein
VAAIYVQRGMSPRRARAAARLGVATTRGLLLDLLATEDRAGVDDAMELFIELSEALFSDEPPAPPSSRAPARAPAR